MATYTVVGASATPIFTERPNIIRSSILRAVINDWEKVPTILDGLVSGYNVDFRKAYSYGLNDYYRGIWQANNEDELIDWDAVKSWLAGELSTSSSDITYVTNEYDKVITAIYELANIANVFNGKVDKRSGYYINMFNMPTGYAAEVTDVEYERSNPDDDPQAPPEYDLVVTYDMFDPDNKAATLETGKIYKTWSDFRDPGSTLNKVVRIRFSYGATSDFYFTYDPQKWTYPDLTEIILGGIQSQYYPLALIRLGSLESSPEWIGEESTEDAEENAERLKQTERLLEYYGMDLDTIKENLESNPDIAEVNRAYIAPALVISDILELDEILLEYLYKFMEYIIENYGPKTKLEWEESGNIYRGDTSYLWFYEQIPSSFKVQLSWGYMDSQTIPYINGESGYKFGKYINYDQGYNDTWEIEEQTGEVSYIYVDYYDAVARTGRRMRVGNLANKLVTNYLDSTQTPIYTLRNAFPLDSEDVLSGIVIPMNHTVVSSMSKSKATAAMLSSMVLVTQSSKQIKLKWYEREDFWAAVKVIVFVVSVIYMSPQIGVAVQQGISEVVAYILEAIIIGAAVSEAVGVVTTFLANQFGGEVALVLAIIAAAVSAYYGFTGETFAYLPNAEDMLKIVTLVAQNINEFTEEEFKDLEEEYAEFLTEYNEAMDALEEASDGLLDVGVDPAWIVRNTGFLANETPDNFFGRTVGSPNPGVYALDALTNFYEGQLELPSVNTSGLSL